MHAQTLIAFGSILLIYVVLTEWSSRLAESRLDRWAAQQKLTILRRRYTHDYPKWRFGIRPKGLFYVLVQDESGAEKVAWIKTGGLFSELFDCEIVVIWNEAAWGFR